MPPFNSQFGQLNTAKKTFHNLCYKWSVTLPVLCWLRSWWPRLVIVSMILLSADRPSFLRSWFILIILSMKLAMRWIKFTVHILCMMMKWIVAHRFYVLNELQCIEYMHEINFSTLILCVEWTLMCRFYAYNQLLWHICRFYACNQLLWHICRFQILCL